MIQEAEEQVRIVREKLKTAQSRQKSQYDRKHKAMTFEVDEKAYLRVTPLKGTHRFGIKGKLAPRYIGPFRILAKRGEVAYQLELPPPRRSQYFRSNKREQPHTDLIIQICDWVRDHLRKINSLV